MLSGDRIGRQGLEQGNVEDWMKFEGGGECQLVGVGGDHCIDGIRTNPFQSSLHEVLGVRIFLIHSNT